MRVVVIGAGAIGTLYGGWLLSGGADVTFVARGGRFQQIRDKGLLIVGPRGETRHPSVRVVPDLKGLEVADVLVFAVKLYDLVPAASSARELLAGDGLAVGLQNGVESWNVLTQTFSRRQVMVGPAYSVAKLEDDGSVRYDGERNDVVIGAIDAPTHPHAETLVATWRAAGVQSSISGDIRTALWTKFLALATNAALTCLSRQSAGVVYHEPNLLELATRSIAEVATVARAEGAKLEATARDSALRLLQRFPPTSWRRCVRTLMQDVLSSLKESVGPWFARGGSTAFQHHSTMSLMPALSPSRTEPRNSERNAIDPCGLALE